MSDANMLSKKPVRRTTAKPAKSKPTTRSKNTEPDPEQEQTEDELQQPTIEEPSAPTTRAARKVQAPAAKQELPKATRRPATRAMKEEPKKAAVAAQPTSKASKGRSAKPRVEEVDAPKLPPPAPSRATRATRATAAKEKAIPLSPKKVTQVSKASTRSTRVGANKSMAKKAADSKPTTKGRPPLRRKNISNENADPSEPKDATDSEEDEIVVKPTRTTRPVLKSKKASDPEPLRVRESSPASSRPDSPSEASEKMSEDEQEDLQHGEEQLSIPEENEEAEENHSQEDSSDELCGPKTPMKRCSPREGMRYASTHKSAQGLNIPSKTPLRRFELLGAHQGTPQTQKPNRKPAGPSSETRPTTVARARDRAMVFPRLEPFFLDLQEGDEEDGDENGEREDLDTDDDENGKVGSPSFEGTPMRIESETHSEDQPFACEDENGFSIIKTSDVELETANDVGLHTATDQDAEISMPVDLHDSEEDTNMAELNSITAEEALSPNGEHSEMIGLGNGSEASFESENSVVVTRTRSSPAPSINAAQLATTTPKPETLVWENIREDVTIPFEFDSNLAKSHGLPQVEHDERLSIIPPGYAAQEPAQSENDTINLAASEPQPVLPLGSLVRRGSRDSIRNSMNIDATVNFSDFIDVNSLAEPGATDGHDTEVALKDNRGGDRAAAADPDDHGVVAAGESHWVSPVRMPKTPVRDISELDIALYDLQEAQADTPGYAMPTIASRRKSLPAMPFHTPAKEGMRPYTSDGASMPRVSNPFTSAVLSRSKNAFKVNTPAPTRPTTSHSVRGDTGMESWAKTPGTSVPQATKLTVRKKTPVSRRLFARTPGTSVPESMASVNRSPNPPFREANEIFGESKGTSTSVPKERFPGLPSRETYEAFVETPGRNSLGEATPATVKPASKKRPRESSITGKEILSTPEALQGKRSPRLPARCIYTEHAKTAKPKSRFQTPRHGTALRRPATTQKPASLRKVALKASTPMKTPLKGGGLTPGQEPMTPHPAAPLRGVVALAEVYTSDGSCATPAFTVLLQRLGAKTTKTFSERVTHVIFKEGSPQTLARLRVHNKQVAETGIGREIHCVNSRWVSDCDKQGKRMVELDEAYAVDMMEVPRSAKRRRKSMEPISLMNIGGNVVRDRKSSLGRGSLSRLSLKFDSPSVLDKTPISASSEDKENCDEEASPATPAYLAAPDSLVQQTAPLNRMKKLDFGGRQAKNRRLTFWNGGA